jgi:hypothetical protein
VRLDSQESFIGMPKQKRNWLIDAGLFIGYLLTFFLDLTGLWWHQWLGVGVGALALYHLWVHWDWTVNVTKRFFGKTSNQCRLFYVIDWLLVLSYAVILVSGLVISTWFNLELSDYLLWLDYHVYSSIAALAITMVKIGTHWRWIVKTASKYFGLWRQPAPTLAAQPVLNNPHTSTLNRREFLQLMGVVSLTSLISAANLLEFREEEFSSLITNQTASTDLGSAENLAASNQINSDCTVICDQGCTYPGECRRYIDQNNNGICDLTECASSVLAENANQDTKIEYQGDGSETTSESESYPEAPQTGELECVVLCSKSCSFPGDCEDYIDLNSNNLCDLGECLVSNLTLSSDQSAEPSHGGGKRRRGN